MLYINDFHYYLIPPKNNILSFRAIKTKQGALTHVFLLLLQKVNLIS